MTTHDMPDTEREALSALFDGELQGDARRFASRRLAHDAGWQDNCGRWQLIGDALRRQAPIAAPADFAARVRNAVAAEASPLAAPAAVASARRPVRLWAGGALAASLAALAVFATRSPAPAPAAVAPPAVASAASTPSATVAVASPAIADAAVAATGAPPPAATRDAPVDRIAAVERAPARIAARTSPRPSRASAHESRAPAAVLAASTFTPPDAANPFHVPPADPLSARPWPRGALSGNAGLTASYGAPANSRGDSPSFYPFEPRTQAETDIRVESP